VGWGGGGGGFVNLSSSRRTTALIIQLSGNCLERSKGGAGIWNDFGGKKWGVTLLTLFSPKTTEVTLDRLELQWASRALRYLPKGITNENFDPQKAVCGGTGAVPRQVN